MELGVLPQGEPGVFRSLLMPETAAALAAGDPLTAVRTLLFLPTLSDLSDEAKQALTAAIQHLVERYQAVMEEICRKMEVA